MAESSKTPTVAPEVAGWGRRIAALFVDWFVALLTVAAITQTQLFAPDSGSVWYPLVAFWVEVSVLTGLLGYSFGKRLVGLEVVGVDGLPIGLLKGLVRTLLVCLLVPPLVVNQDRRGLHDLAAGSTVRQRS